MPRDVDPGWKWGRHCGRAWRAAGPWPHDDATYRRRHFRFWYFIFLVWFAAAVAQGSAAFLRWIAGPLSGGGGLQIPLMLVVAGCVVLAITVLSRSVGSPLSEVIAASDRVAAGDLTVRIREHGAPWIRALARAFNSMTLSLEAQHRQRRELMADVAHELRTPLTAMQGRLEGMVDGIYSADATHVQRVLDDTRLLARLVEDLRTLAHSESGTLPLEREPADVGILAGEVAEMFRAEAGNRRVRLVVSTPSPLPLMEVDPVRIREVLSNLISNALRYAPEGGTVALEVEPNPNGVTMRVSDDGPGIPAADLPHIFDRFYKGSGSTGSGLGLTIARNLMIAHGGTLAAATRPEGGTTFTARLPLKPEGNGD